MCLGGIEWESRVPTPRLGALSRAGCLDHVLSMVYSTTGQSGYDVDEGFFNAYHALGALDLRRATGNSTYDFMGRLQVHWSGTRCFTLKNTLR